jgi:hypothetical protein
MKSFPQCRLLAHGAHDAYSWCPRHAKPGRPVEHISREPQSTRLLDLPSPKEQDI